MSAFLCIVAILAMPQDDLKTRYEKIEMMVPMRDGVKLYTSAFVPRAPGSYPVLMERTPYSSGPYGPDQYGGVTFKSPKFDKAGYIFVRQDVRGKFKSEGDFVDVRPLLAKHDTPKEVDESTDAYDTIDYLVKNLPRNNGKVGVVGTSYPGFYAACAAVSGHPALKVASPQAPVTDWFMGDDFHHNGALFLQDAAEFYNGFGVARPSPTTDWAPPATESLQGNRYNLYMGVGPVSNMDRIFFKGKVSFWNEMLAHPTYDSWWKARNPRPFMKDLKCSILTVGGFFDAEDMYGALKLFSAIESQNPKLDAHLVMGPWYHGGWSDRPGRTFGDLDFGQDTSTYFEDDVEFPYLNHILNDGPDPKLPKALVFATGRNQWISLDSWPTKKTTDLPMWLQDDGTLGMSEPKHVSSYSYVSDAKRPVPYANGVLTDRSREYMVADQKFATGRLDVATFMGDPLKEDTTVIGEVEANLELQSDANDGDFIVKVIDIWPDGFQQLLRWEVMRGRFWKGFERATPLPIDQPFSLHFPLNEVCHTFLAGHKIAVQVQSSMFPLIDRNPQTFVSDIAFASGNEFRIAKQQIINRSHVVFKVMH